MEPEVEILEHSYDLQKQMCYHVPAQPQISIALSICMSFCCSYL